MEKGPDAFRTISEVAEDLDLPQHVLRFWETRFGQIKPLKRGGGRRYYRPDDVDLLRGIRHLLYGEGYTIRGVQQILREQGVRHVQAIGQSAAEEAVRSGDDRHAEGRSGGLMNLLPSLRGAPHKPELPRVVEIPIPQHETEAPEPEDQLPQFLRKSSADPDGSLPAADAGDEPSIAAAGNGSAARLSADAIDLLKATLNELGECRRMLDTAREREW